MSQSLIFLVGDDPFTLLNHREIILKFGITNKVKIFISADNAIFILRESIRLKQPIPDYIFLDLETQGMDWKDFIYEYQKLLPGQLCKMIMVSANNRIVNLQKLRQLGVSKV